MSDARLDEIGPLCHRLGGDLRVEDVRLLVRLAGRGQEAQAGYGEDCVTRASQARGSDDRS